MNKKMKKALVTGGAGFIGSHLVDALLSDGCQVVVLDNLTTGRLSNLEHVIDKISFHKGDIRDRETLANAVKGCEVVFHQAAMVSVPRTVEDPLGSAMINEIGTLLVLEAARNIMSNALFLQARVRFTAMTRTCPRWRKWWLNL